MKLANRVWCHGSGSEIPFGYRVRDRLPSGLYRCPCCGKDFKAYNPFSIQQRLAIPRHKHEAKARAALAKAGAL